MEKMCKNDLMNLIQSTNFTLIELGLYLDTHPNCPCGLSAYQDYSDMLKRAVEIYERRFEPITRPHGHGRKDVTVNVELY